MLEVITSEGYGTEASFGKQIWYRRGTIGTNSMQTFYRTWSGTTWEPWQRFLNVEYAAGGVGDLSTPIYITSGGVPTACSGIASKPKTDTITLSTSWTGSGPYTQTVTLGTNTPTANSKIDL